MNRSEMLPRIERGREPWDIVVIGGGAVGAGVAVDASSRGLAVLLVEREDFGKGTSSRSTKLVHGGVRYLEQGNISLVMEALRERGLLLRNAPHMVHDLPFVVPNYSWWEAPFYGIGMKVYDLLAGKYNFGKSRVLSLAETLERLPGIQREGLRGGVLYHEGQFDDARLLMHLLQTAVDHGATVINYAKAMELLKDEAGFLCVDHAITLGSLRESDCLSQDLKIHGYHPHPGELGSLAVYGTDAAAIRGIARADPALAQPLHPALPCIGAEILWSVRHEMSRTLDDALARRTRSLLLNARAAVAIAPRVARLVAEELGRGQVWIDAQVRSFKELAKQYILDSDAAPAAGGAM